MKRALVLITLLAALSLTVAACGNSEGSPSTSLRVTLTDFAFSPNTWTVPAGKQISLDITNNGATTHSFVIMRAGHAVQLHFADADKAFIYWAQAHIPPGESVKASFTAPGEPGEYQVLCDLVGHFEAGMVGKLNVVK